MIIRYIIIIQTINHFSNSEVPQSSCLPLNRFHKANLSCRNFNDFCVKKECYNFQAACSENPPSHLTVSVLQHLKKQVNDFHKQIKTLTVLMCAIIILVFLFLYKSKSIDNKKILLEIKELVREDNKKILLEIKELVREKDEKSQNITNENKEFLKEIKKMIIEKDERFSNEKYNSLSEQYNNINNLEMSEFEKCFDNVNKFNKYYKSKIINCIINKSSINEERKISLNCLYVSINIISKYIEDHPSSIFVSDSNLVCTFDGFSDMISSHHLAERICESILYAMCSLMKLSEKKVDQEFWTNKLERLILNDKISEENKLASCVILVQLDISKNDVIFQIADYLINKINIDCSQEYFGFSQSEILSARRNAEKKLESFSKTTENKCTHINKRN